MSTWMGRSQGSVGVQGLVAPWRLGLLAGTASGHGSLLPCIPCIQPPLGSPPQNPDPCCLLHPPGSCALSALVPSAAPLAFCPPPVEPHCLGLCTTSSCASRPRNLCDAGLPAAFPGSSPPPQIPTCPICLNPNSCKPQCLQTPVPVNQEPGVSRTSRELCYVRNIRELDLDGGHLVGLRVGRLRRSCSRVGHWHDDVRGGLHY